MKWFIPSNFGDLTLRSAEGSSLTEVHASELTNTERRGLHELLVAHGLRGDVENTIDEHLSLGKPFLIDAALGAVRKELTALLRPGRRIVDVVKMSDGALEEWKEDAQGNRIVEPKPRKKRQTGGGQLTEKTQPEPTPEVGASVALPTRGCPMPIFEASEAKANAVLRTFLSPGQRTMYECAGQVVTRGHESGHPYVVTVRTSPRLPQFGRQLRDLQTGEDFCVHDWDVPPSEEVLALVLLLQVPGFERWLRYIETDLDPGQSVIAAWARQVVRGQNA